MKCSSIRRSPSGSCILLRNRTVQVSVLGDTGTLRRKEFQLNLRNEGKETCPWLFRKFGFLPAVHYCKLYTHRMHPIARRPGNYPADVRRPLPICGLTPMYITLHTSRVTACRRGARRLGKSGRAGCLKRGRHPIGRRRARRRERAWDGWVDAHQRQWKADPNLFNCFEQISNCFPFFNQPFNCFAHF